jgi:hypothetical protein
MGKVVGGAHSPGFSLMTGMDEIRNRYPGPVEIAMIEQTRSVVPKPGQKQVGSRFRIAIKADHRRTARAVALSSGRKDAHVLTDKYDTRISSAVQSDRLLEELPCRYSIRLAGVCVDAQGLGQASPPRTSQIQNQHRRTQLVARNADMIPQRPALPWIRRRWAAAKTGQTPEHERAYRLTIVEGMTVSANAGRQLC